MRRLVTIATLLAVAGCGSSGPDHAAFRARYIEGATYGDKFARQPPSLTDAQIDEAIKEVCVDFGRRQTKAADAIGETLARQTNDAFDGTTLGSAIYSAALNVGCPARRKLNASTTEPAHSVQFCLTGTAGGAAVIYGVGSGDSTDVYKSPGACWAGRPLEGGDSAHMIVTNPDTGNIGCTIAIDGKRVATDSASETVATCTADAP